MDWLLSAVGFPATRCGSSGLTRKGSSLRNYSLGASVILGRAPSAVPMGTGPRVGTVTGSRGRYHTQFARGGRTRWSRVSACPGVSLVGLGGKQDQSMRAQGGMKLGGPQCRPDSPICESQYSRAQESCPDTHTYIK